jgi:hypothetical protein
VTHFPEKCLVAELPLRRIPRFFRRYSRSDVFLRFHLQVEPHLLFQIAIESLSLQVEEQPAPEL